MRPFGRGAGLGDALDNRAGRRRFRRVSDAERKSGPNFVLRFRSNNTSSLPFAGRWAYNAEMIARVLTVESITD